MNLSRFRLGAKGAMLFGFGNSESVSCGLSIHQHEDAEIERKRLPLLGLIDFQSAFTFIFIPRILDFKTQVVWIVHPLVKEPGQGAPRFRLKASAEVFCFNGMTCKLLQIRFDAAEEGFVSQLLSQGMQSAGTAWIEVAVKHIP